MGDLKAGVEGPETLLTLVALDDILEDWEGGSTRIGESYGFNLGEWTLDARPELGLELDRSSDWNVAGTGWPSWASVASLAAPTLAFILL